MIGKQKNVKFKYFIAQYQLDIFNNSFIPKFLSFFKNNQKNLWKNYISTMQTKTNLGFISEKEYLLSYNLTKENIVKNSVNYCLPDIDNDDIEYLTEQFLLFSKSNKIKIINENNKSTPVYLEIINALNYIKQIQEIINKYPNNDGNQLGTKHRSSSYKNLLKKQLSELENRLENPFFPIENEDEIVKTNKQIKFIKYALEDEYKNLPEWFNHASVYIGFDNKLLGLSLLEQQTFKQLTTFFNGIKTSKEELLKSVSIFTREQSKISNEDEIHHKEFKENMHIIIQYFFIETINELEMIKDSKKFNYTKKDITKEYSIKTIIYDLPIYTYVYKNSNNAFNELFEIGVQSILGIQSIVDKENPTEDEISHVKTKRNLIEARNELTLTKKEFKAILHLSKFL